MAWKKLDEAAAWPPTVTNGGALMSGRALLALKDRTNDDLTAVEAFRQAADDPSSLPENGWPERLASALAGRFAAAGNGEAGQKEDLLSDVIDVMQQMRAKLPAQLRPTVDPHYGRLLHRQIERLLVAVEAPADFQRLLDACQVYADQIGVSGPPDPLVVACRAGMRRQTTAGDSGWVQVRHFARETADLIDRQDIAMDADASAYVRYVAVIADSHGSDAIRAEEAAARLHEVLSSTELRLGNWLMAPQRRQRSVGFLITAADELRTSLPLPAPCFERTKADLAVAYLRMAERLTSFPPIKPTETLIFNLALALAYCQNGDAEANSPLVLELLKDSRSGARSPIRRTDGYIWLRLPPTHALVMPDEPSRATP